MTSEELDELEEMHSCERPTYVGSLNLGPCGLCYGIGMVEHMGCALEPCPNTEPREKAYQEWKRTKLSLNLEATNDNLDVQ